jgi:hypothetical protein
MTAGVFATILAFVESNHELEAWGDDGLAMGLYQAHAAWVVTYAKRYNIWPAVDEGWNSWVRRLIGAFFAEYSKTWTDTEVAMHYHLGHPSVAQDLDWDAKYASRFREMASQLGNAAT